LHQQSLILAPFFGQTVVPGSELANNGCLVAPRARLCSSAEHQQTLPWRSFRTLVPYS
jgi:hypothetical protein